MTWQAFVASAPAGARVAVLAAVVGQPVSTVASMRRRVRVGRPDGAPSGFAELWRRFHGVPPREEDWPALKNQRNSYAWTGPELALVARLLGQLGPDQILETLTVRLRLVTGDPAAVRTRSQLNFAIKHVGLHTGDVVGGLTVAAAGRRLGNRAVLDREIRAGRLTARRVGRLLVIPHDEFDRWLAGRTLPPAGYVRLASLKRPLGIRSDKLSEWARAGHVPSALRCSGYGGGPSTKFGTWWIAEATFKKLVADRRAGRPMPWHGKPFSDNLGVTWRLLQARRHPESCAECAAIWGAQGSPRTYDDYAQRYPPLTHGAKRHLTRPWTPGLSRTQVAAHCGVGISVVSLAIANGALRTQQHGTRVFITRTDATRWKARRCPTGARDMSWMPISSACKFYSFTPEDLQAHIDGGRLRTKIYTVGWLRGQPAVLRQQVRELRDELGYSEAAAAKRVGVSVARLRVLIRSLGWRPSERIRLEVVQNAIKREQSSCGFTMAEAAATLGRSRAWVLQQVRDGVIRLLRVPWAKRRLYVSKPMLKRLEAAARIGARPRPLNAAWMRLGAAATHAGVSTTTIQRWALDGELQTRDDVGGQRYHRTSVEARARRYYQSECRYKRPTVPEWLQVVA